MRWTVVVAVVTVALAGCTSMWDKHKERLAEYEAQRDYPKALAQQRWLIDNAPYQAPRAENAPEAEAQRFLELARLAAKTNNQRLAVDSLRKALAADPTRAPAVRRQLDALPLTQRERSRLDREFAWNIAALQPGEDTFEETVPAETACWSYRVREIRIGRKRTVSTPEGRQHQVSYDARAWVFDGDTRQWRADGGWVDDVGTETELVNGPSQPRYRALLAGGSHFYFCSEGRVPPCHRNGWRGPFDPDGSVFVATQLPTTP